MELNENLWPRVHNISKICTFQFFIKRQKDVLVNDPLIKEARICVYNKICVEATLSSARHHTLF